MKLTITILRPLGASACLDVVEAASDAEADAFAVWMPGLTR